MANTLKTKKITVAAGEEKTLMLSHLASYDISVQQGATLRMGGCIMESVPERARISITLAGSGAACDVACVILGRESHQFPLDLTVYHHACTTRAHVVFRSALADYSTINLCATLHVQKAALGCITYFSHHALLLSNTSRATTIPSLEIKTDEVRAGHAASCGHLDEEALVYAGTRGIAPQSARELLIPAFLAQALDDAPEPLAGEMRASLEKIFPRYV